MARAGFSYALARTVIAGEADDVEQEYASEDEASLGGE